MATSPWSMRKRILSRASPTTRHRQTTSPTAVIVSIRIWSDISRHRRPEPKCADRGWGHGSASVSLASGVYTDASLSLTIANTNGTGTIRYTTDKSVPTASSPAYTAPITLSVNTTIKARIFPPAGTNRLPSAVVARNFVFLDNTSSTFNSRLPTVIISTEGQAIPVSVPPGSPRAKGSVVIIDTEQGRRVHPRRDDVHELAEFEIFGQTS